MLVSNTEQAVVQYGAPGKLYNTVQSVLCNEFARPCLVQTGQRGKARSSNFEQWIAVRDLNHRSILFDRLDNTTSIMVVPYDDFLLMARGTSRLYKQLVVKHCVPSSGNASRFSSWCRPPSKQPAAERRLFLGCHADLTKLPTPVLRWSFGLTWMR